MPPRVLPAAATKTTSQTLSYRKSAPARIASEENGIIVADRTQARKRPKSPRFSSIFIVTEIVLHLALCGIAEMDGIRGAAMVT